MRAFHNLLDRLGNLISSYLKSMGSSYLQRRQMCWEYTAGPLINLFTVLGPYHFWEFWVTSNSGLKARLLGVWSQQILWLSTQQVENLGCSFALFPAGSLTALVCQHSITPLALPCKLLIPERGMRWRAECGRAVCRWGPCVGSAPLFTACCSQDSWKALKK